MLADSDSRSVVAADFNRDGAVDLLVGSVGGGPMRLFLGYADGVACCTASLFLAAGTGHVFDVSTSSGARGRGYGAAMMHAVLQHARGAGARRAGLEASDEGLGVYRRMGFREVGILRVYSNSRYIAGRGNA